MVSHSCEGYRVSIMADCFKLKADFAPLTVLKFLTDKWDQLESQLESTLSKAPNYFDNAPIILDVLTLDRPHEGLALEKIAHVLEEKGLHPVGVRGLADNELTIAKRCGLAVMNRQQKPAPDVKKETPPPEVKQPVTQAQPGSTVVVEKSIRSGNQIYNKHGDIIVLGSVNPGSEVVAAGNIHVHGSIQGRAVAGAHGNENAHIFCKTLKAELVSIAGFYAVDKVIKPPKKAASMIHVYLKESNVIVENT